MKDIKEENKAIKTIAKGAGYVFVGMVISKFLSYLYRMVVARIGTQEYGVLSLGLAIVGILSFIPLLGLDQGVLRYVSYYLGKKDHDKVRSTIKTSLMVSLPFSIIISALVFIFSEQISLYLFKNMALIPVLRILVVSIPFLIAGNIFLSVIRAFKNAKYFALIKNINENLVKLILTLILLIFGLKVMGAAIAYLIAIASTAIISFYIVKKKMLTTIVSKIESYFKVKNKVFRIKGLLSYSFPLMIYALILQIIVWTDILMIGFFRTESEVGIYNAALPTATLMSIIPQGIIVLFLPVMTGLLAKHELFSFKKTFKTTTNWIFVSNLPIFIIVVIFSKQILRILFGSNYIPGYLPLIILIPSYFVYHLFTTSSQTLNVLKKSKYLMINMTVAAAINIILNYLLIPRTDSLGGMVGGAIATSTSLIIYGLLCGIESYYFTKINPFQKNQFKIILIGIASYVSTNYIFNLIQQKTFFNLILLGLLFIFIYVGLILLFKCLNKEDYEILIYAKLRILSLFSSNNK